MALLKGVSCNPHSVLFFSVRLVGFTHPLPPPLLAVTRRELLTTPYNLSQDGFLVRPGGRVLPSLFLGALFLLGIYICIVSHSLFSPSFFYPRSSRPIPLRTNLEVLSTAIAKLFGAIGRVIPPAGPDLSLPWIWYLGAWFLPRHQCCAF